MREALRSEFGVAVAWADTRARNTRENAANSAALLLPEGRRRILLVTHGFDVARARRLFEAAGLTVLAAPTLIPNRSEIEAGDLLPNASALYTSHYACYEILALAADWLFRALEPPRR
jgi:uncharacterized SAM-binding protein YcdF (DUF218 family)